MLCGISTSFPVLSPTIRQVAHALLTRPPLIRTRRRFTVRLECVMHAASVHPEPGSNSLKNCISTGLRRIDPIFQSKIFFARLLLRASLNSKEFSESFVLRCCSIFNEPGLSVFVTARLFYHMHPPLSTPFRKFLSIFSGAGGLRQAPLSRQPRHSTTEGTYCQGLF